MRDLGLRSEEKALRTPYFGFSILRGGLMGKMETNFSVGPVMIGQAGMVLKRVNLDKIKGRFFSYGEGSETLKQVVKGGHRCPNPGNIQTSTRIFAAVEI